MAGDDARKATDAELDILNVLWRVGPSSVRDVHEAMTRLRGIRYTTTLKTLQVMTGKGLVSRDESSGAHIYAAAVGQQEPQRSLAGALVEKSSAVLRRVVRQEGIARRVGQDPPAVG